MIERGITFCVACTGVTMLALRTFWASLIVCLIALAPGMAGAGSLSSPTGPVVLTVSGHITNTNAGKSAEFDMAMLEALPGRTAKVSTPWAEGVNAFQGPLTRAVLEAVGAQGTKLKVIALNDYSADVPAEDFVKFDVILALKKNDAYCRCVIRGQFSSYIPSIQILTFITRYILAGRYGR